MILDARRLGEKNISCDICLVGAGVAGIALATRLLGTGLKVILLEAGGERYSEQEQRHFDGQVIDPTTQPRLDRYRIRQFGGTSTVWGGRCAPFSSFDFGSRPESSLQAWPITEAELLPHYSRAHSILDLGEYCYDAENCLPGSIVKALPGVNFEEIDDTSLWRFSLPTDLGKKYRRLLASSGDVCVLLHAPCCELNTMGDGRTASTASVALPGGDRLKVSARAFVLTAGTLETARILLLSRNHQAAGLGNSGDQVGRCYMTHLYGTVGGVRYRGDPRAVRYGFETSHDGVYVRHMFRLKDQAQARRGIMQCCAVLASPPFGEPSHESGILSAAFLAKGLIGRRIPVELLGPNQKVFGVTSLSLHLRNVVRDTPATATFAIDWLRRRILSKRKLPAVELFSRSGKYDLLYSAEQFPNPESRIQLSERRDEFGVNQLRSEWRVSERDVVSIAETHKVFAAEFARPENAICEFDADWENLTQNIQRQASVGSHHMGLARMSERPESGVVNRSCRVHNTTNVYVAGAATFPTSGCVSPTLTIAAIASYVADSLIANYQVALPDCRMTHA